MRPVRIGFEALFSPGALCAFSYVKENSCKTCVGEEEGIRKNWKTRELEGNDFKTKKVTFEN